MKIKTLAAYIAAVSLSAAVFTGCGDTVSKTDESNQPATQAATAENPPEPEAERPTDRVPVKEETADFEYEVINGSAVITKYTGRDKDVTVPAEIAGVPVSGIGFYAFEAKFLVENITLPDTITTIGEYAFQDCSSLKSINIPDSVTTIERGAFVACTSLESLTLPASVQSVKHEAFTACEAMTSLTINNPDLAYEDWGLEELPSLVIYAPDGSAVLDWAQTKGFSFAAV